MTLEQLSPEAYQSYLQTVAECSFLQTNEMATLLEKRGMTVKRLAYRKNGDIRVAGLLYSLPMAGGLHMEMNSGPVTESPEDLPHFYRLLKHYAKTNGALELIVKPYQTYQFFDTNGNPTSSEYTELISHLTDQGFSFDGLQTGYPGGEPDWHYVKDLKGLTKENLAASFDKKGKALLKKTKSFGIQIRKLRREELPAFTAITSATSERREYKDKSLDYYQDFYDSFGDKAEFLVASINFKDYKANIAAGQELLAQKLKAIEADLEHNPNSRKKQNERKEYQSQFDTFTARLKEATALIAQYGEEDIDLAASLFVYTPHELVYLFSGSHTAFNKFYAPILLQEKAMETALERSIDFYNFLGIQGLFDGSDGVLRFKQNFNGSIVRKMGTFRYYPKPLTFKVISLIKKILRRH